MSNQVKVPKLHIKIFNIIFRPKYRQQKVLLNWPKVGFSFATRAAVAAAAYASAVVVCRQQDMAQVVEGEKRRRILYTALYLKRVRRATASWFHFEQHLADEGD